jgi:hypothetical protein
MKLQNKIRNGLKQGFYGWKLMPGGYLASAPFFFGGNSLVVGHTHEWPAKTRVPGTGRVDLG